MNEKHREQGAQDLERGSLRHGRSALAEATGTNGLNFIFCNTLAVPPEHPRSSDLLHGSISLANAGR